MYVTVITGPDGGIAYGPHPTADPSVAAATSDAPPITARLCPPGLVDRSSGIDRNAIVYLQPAATRNLLSRTGQEPHPDHQHCVVAVVVHPTTRRAAVVGPFTHAEAQHWWATHTLLAQIDAQMTVLPLIALADGQTAPASATEGA